MNDIKRHLHELTQETQGSWLKVLPIALMMEKTTVPFHLKFGVSFMKSKLEICIRICAGF